MAADSDLTSNDSVVLDRIFEPESAPTTQILVDPSLPSDPNMEDLEVLATINKKEKEIIQNLERVLKASNPKSNEGRNALSEAYMRLTKLIESHPKSAALRNDRTQVFRLHYGDDTIIPTEDSKLRPDIASKTVVALSDLTEAIRLMTPPAAQSRISPLQCRILAQAYTQRGALFHRASKSLAEKGPDAVITGGQLSPFQELSGWQVIDLEEAASKDFFMGGRYGNEIGKALAVHTNPTAKLCGQIVQEAMKKEFLPVEGSSA